MKNRERLTDEDYQPYFDHFEPDLYDPRKWARAAREAGMKYAVLTTKHHEGFCLWDSEVSDYTVAKLYEIVQIEWLGTWPVIGPLSTLVTRPLPS